jgi:flavodoxin
VIRIVEPLAHLRERYHQRVVSVEERMNVLVAYESRTGKTKNAASAIADAARSSGNDVSVKPLSEVSVEDLGRAELVFLGTWIEGFILFGVGPARSALKRIGTLQLSGKDVASFCTFAVAPRGSMAKLRGALESRGASVVAERAFNRGRAKAEAPAFANEVLSKI